VSTPDFADPRKQTDPTGRLLRDLLRRGLPLDALPAAARLVVELEALAAERRRESLRKGA
jgi:hypothetical protein